MRLAKEIISLYHNNDVALKVEKEFERIFKEKGLPKKIPEIKVSFPVSLIEVLVASKMVKSKGEANRLLDQKGIKINQKVIGKDIILEDTKKEDIIIQKGKRHFIKLIK
jgi:tyrosyl-tRNA synthetase